MLSVEFDSTGAPIGLADSQPPASCFQPCGGRLPFLLLAIAGGRRIAAVAWRDRAIVREWSLRLHRPYASRWPPPLVPSRAQLGFAFFAGQSAHFTAITKCDKCWIALDAKFAEELRLAVAIHGSNLEAFGDHFVNDRLHHPAVAAPIGLKIKQNCFAKCSIGQSQNRA